MLTTPELVGILVSMKARLAFGNGAKMQAVLNAVLVIVGIGAIAGMVYLVLWMRGAEDSATQLMLLLSAIGVLWFVLSIIAGSGESVLNPGLFSIYPVSVRQLVLAFLAAAFVGVAAPGTAIVAFSTVSHASSVTSVVLIIVAACVVTATAVLSGRYGVAIMSSLVRGRGTREVAGFLAVGIGGFAGLAPQFLFEARDFFGVPERSLARRVLAWVPWGWGPESIASATEGRNGRAALFLMVAVLFAVVIGESWRRTLEKILTTRPAASEATSIDGGLVPKVLQPFRRRPVVATTARTFRQLRRDPREFLEMASFMPVVLVSAFPVVDAIRSGEPEVVLSVTGVGIALGITSLNMFGADGKSFGVDVFASGDLTPVIFGKALARALVAAPLIVLVGLVLAVVSGGWEFLMTSYLISTTALLAMLSVGMIVSVRYPIPLPDQVAVGGGAGASGANGCATAMLRLVAMLAAGIAAAIGAVPAVLVSVFVNHWLGTLVGVASLIYGVALFWFAGRYAGKNANQRTPELFQILSTSLS